MSALTLQLPVGDPLAAQVPGLAVSGRLVAPSPTWQLTTDVLVIGSGVAGLSVLRGLAGSGLRVHLVTKATLEAGSTRWAQGGIARATADLDDADLHVRDTLIAGAGLCDPAAVRILVDEGPDAVQALAEAGARFDLGADGRVAQTREGGHSRARIVHSGGDATGREVQRTLQAAIATEVTVHEQAFLLDLLRSDDGSVTGAAIALLDAAGRCRSTGRVHARATVLATGGLGQVFASTTNPSVATGDGIAAALRAGAEVADLEFVQFHPTVLHSPAGSAGAGPGRRLLVSEAVRGEGAVLVDSAGRSVMAGAHPLADLAPRDVVSAAMAAVMAAQGVDHLYLDARRLGEATLLRRFPTIVAGCRAAGVDPVGAPIPVVPAAHYSCGGVRADLSGRTSLAGLFAVGEVACTGVHGANRLASNSLLEGLVAGRRLAELLLGALPPAPDEASSSVSPAPASGVHPGLRPNLTRAMDAAAGVLRSPGALAGLADLLAGASGAAAPDRSGWEATNLHTVMAAIVGAAIRRGESRGCHRRVDEPEPLDGWRRHLVSTTRFDPELGT
ncbi:MAG TPA: L-aspartate oxidase, partial [Kineosporiaceae bacterium]|nr:L-aspartate oxidase [Kineosporiaceae bacterium]